MTMKLAMTLALFLGPACCCGAQDWRPLTEFQQAGLLDWFGRAKPRFKVCVDPGHPSSFSAGDEVLNGAQEYRINWQVALKLKRILSAKGVEVVLTKSSEAQSMENKDRAKLCNLARASAAVHLHCDSEGRPGFAVYYPDRQGVFDYKDDPESGFRGPSEAVIASSARLAAAVHEGMTEGLAGAFGGRVFGDSRSLVGGRQGALTTSIFSVLPTVTVEMVVLSDKGQARFIKSEEGQERMAQAIAAGLLRFKP